MPPPNHFASLRFRSVLIFVPKNSGDLMGVSSPFAIGCIVQKVIVVESSATFCLFVLGAWRLASPHCIAPQLRLKNEEGSLIPKILRTFISRS